MTIIKSLTQPITSSIVNSLISVDVPDGGGITKPTIDNVISEINMTDADAYTFSSGSVIDTIASVEGIGFQSVGAPEYDATVFSGAGGARMTSTTTAIRHATTFTASSTQTVIFAIETQTYTTFGDLFCYALADNNGNTLARITHSGAGDLRYYQNEAGSFQNIQSTGSDGIHIIVLRFNDVTSCDYFFDSTTTTGNFDPKVNYNSQTKIRLGARALSTGVNNTAFGYFLHTSDAMTDQEISDYVTYIASLTNAAIT